MAKNIGDTERHIISTSAKKISTSTGMKKTQQVVYKTALGKVKGKMKYSSKTKHEPVG